MSATTTTSTKYFVERRLDGSDVFVAVLGLGHAEAVEAFAQMEVAQAVLLGAELRVVRRTVSVEEEVVEALAFA